MCSDRACLVLVSVTEASDLIHERNPDDPVTSEHRQGRGYTVNDKSILYD